MDWQTLLYVAIGLFCLGSYINVANGLIKPIGYPSLGRLVAELIKYFAPNFSRHLILVRIIQALIFIISPLIIIIVGIIIAVVSRR